MANKFKGSAPLKAVKSWAGLYLIQLLTQLCYLSSLQRTSLRMCSGQNRHRHNHAGSY